MRTKLKVYLILLNLSFFSCQNSSESGLSEDPQFLCLSGEVVSFSKEKLNCLMFITPDCPLAQSYTLGYNQLQKDFENEIECFGILSGDLYSKNETDHFVDSFGYNAPIILDSDLQIAEALGAQVSPEFFLLDTALRIIYQGKFDNWAISLARKKIRADSLYLRWAIEDHLDDRPIRIPKTTAVGCVIEYD